MPKKKAKKKKAKKSGKLSSDPKNVAMRKWREKHRKAYNEYMKKWRKKNG